MRWCKPRQSLLPLLSAFAGSGRLALCEWAAAPPTRTEIWISAPFASVSVRHAGSVSISQRVAQLSDCSFFFSLPLSKGRWSCGWRSWWTELYSSPTLCRRTRGTTPARRPTACWLRPQPLPTSQWCVRLKSMCRDCESSPCCRRPSNVLQLPCLGSWLTWDADLKLAAGLN